MKSMKENSIQQYISAVNFNEHWSVNDIKNGLQKLLGEIPGIKVNYEKDVSVNEIKGEAVEIKKLKSIEVVFTDLDDQIKKVEYLLEV